MFEPATGSLEFPTSTFNKPEETFYFIDFTKMTRVEDLILVLQALGFGLSDKHPHFELLQKFLDMDKPVKIK